MAVDRQPAAAKLPEADAEKGSGFNVTRIVLDDAFEIVDELLLTLFGILGLTIEIVGLRIDVTAVVLRSVLLQLAGLFDEYLGPLLVFPVCQGHAPVSHRALGIPGGDLPEGPLGLVVPEAVQLPDSLVEELLSLPPGALNREGNLSGALDGQGGVSWALIEGFTLVGVPRLRLVLGGGLLRFFLGQGQGGSDAEQGCQDEVAIQDHGLNTNMVDPFRPSGITVETEGDALAGGEKPRCFLTLRCSPQGPCSEEDTLLVLSGNVSQVKHRQPAGIGRGCDPAIHRFRNGSKLKGFLCGGRGVRLLTPAIRAGKQAACLRSAFFGLVAC